MCHRLSELLSSITSDYIQSINGDLEQIISLLISATNSKNINFENDFVELIGAATMN